MCQPARTRALKPYRQQIPASKSGSRHIGVERKTLLFGTALVSTLLFGSVLASTPTTAQTIVIQQQDLINNSAKITTGLYGVLTFNGSRLNNLDADQLISLTNDIVINNNGDIDPLVAIGADIYNYDIDFENSSLGAYSYVDQENAIINAIIVVNSGGLTATDAGIDATIGNANSVLYNEGFAATFETDDIVILDQATEVTQANTLTNAIILETDGNIAAGLDGIGAFIDNSSLQILSNAEAENSSAGDGAVFAKVDVTFGDDVDGIGGKAGMRVSW